MQMKKFVIVKHIQGGGKYLFYVPKDVTLEAGDKVVCDTSRGADQLGVCCCDSFVAEPKDICPLFGTQPEKMRYVTGIVTYNKFDTTDEEEDEKQFGEE